MKKSKRMRTVAAIANFTPLTLLLHIVFALMHNVGSHEYQPLPSLDAFDSYEDMQSYFTQCNQASMRHIDNPNDDSYLLAFNQCNEQLAVDSNQFTPTDKIIHAHLRAKRSKRAKKLPTEPKLIPFEIADAIEPSDEVKILQRKHRTHITPESTIAKSGNSTTAVTAKSVKRPVRNNRKLHRIKRFVLQQPVNFKVHMIPFDINDAREPDEPTKKLIKHMRALTIAENNKTSVTQKTTLSSNSSHAAAAAETVTNLKTTTNSESKQAVVPQKLQVKEKAKENVPSLRQNARKIKRSKRSTPIMQQQQTPPVMFKFELSDAKANVMENPRKSKVVNQTHTTTENRTDHSPTDLQNEDSKLIYLYKESAGLKPKKPLNSLPRGVQKAITRLLKDQSGGKVYHKYMPPQKLNYEHLKNYYTTNAKLVPPVFVQKLQPASDVNYAPKQEAVKTTHSVTHLTYVPQREVVQAIQPTAHVNYIPKQEAIQTVQIPSVPVVEKLNYVYTPVPVYHIHDAITQPVVVAADESATQNPAEIHHTYSAKLAPLEEENKIQQAPFQPSKLDSLLGQNTLYESAANSLDSGHIKPNVLYKYDINWFKLNEYAKPQLQLLSQQQQQQQQQQELQQQTEQPAIKIEYHGPADPLKQNYKNLVEFKELSTLLGKSAEDQLHGLTYLVAKEMQNKLQRQAKKLENVERPQDNTAPILFHAIQPEVPTPNLKPLIDQSAFGLTKQYIPIVENGNEQADKSIIGTIPYNEHEELKIPTPNSFVEYAYGQDLSNGHVNLNEAKHFEQPNTQVTSTDHSIHYPNVVHHTTDHAVHSPNIIHHKNIVAQQHTENSKSATGGEQPTNNVHNSINQNIHKEQLQYASKYAFGYRIRDFHTGNDFGHKQNRDLNGVTHGQYHILLPDGRIQNVIYHADDTGFHADVNFESGH